MRKEFGGAFLAFTISLTSACSRLEASGHVTSNTKTPAEERLEQALKETGEPEINIYDSFIAGTIEYENFSILIHQTHTDFQTSIAIEITNKDTTGEFTKENILIVKTQNKIIQTSKTQNFEGVHSNKPELLKNPEVLSGIDKMIKKAGGKFDPLKIVLGRN